jgi:hypothetical protein
VLDKNTGERRDFRGSFLVSAEGGASSARKQMGMILTGNTYQDRFLLCGSTIEYAKVFPGIRCASHHLAAQSLLLRTVCKSHCHRPSSRSLSVRAPPTAPPSSSHVAYLFHPSEWAIIMQQPTKYVEGTRKTGDRTVFQLAPNSDADEEQKEENVRKRLKVGVALLLVRPSCLEAHFCRFCAPLPTEFNRGPRGGV